MTSLYWDSPLVSLDATNPLEGCVGKGTLPGNQNRNESMREFLKGISLFQQLCYDCTSCLLCLWLKNGLTRHALVTQKHQWTGSSLAQSMTCHLFVAKQIPEPMMTFNVYCTLRNRFQWNCNQNSNIFFQGNAPIITHPYTITNPCDLRFPHTVIKSYSHISNPAAPPLTR